MTTTPQFRSPCQHTKKMGNESRQTDVRRYSIYMFRIQNNNNYFLIITALGPQSVVSRWSLLVR